MNVNRHTTHQLGQTFLHGTGATEGNLGERDKVVLGRDGFRASRKGTGREIFRGIKTFFRATGAAKNREAWTAASKGLDLSPGENPRLRSYLERGKPLTMRRVQKALVNPANTKKLNQDFDMPAVTQRIQDRMLHRFGENKATELQSYASTLKTDRANNGVYVKNTAGNGTFAEFHRMEHGMHAPEIRHEKVHLSVHPDDVGRAFEALSPILIDPNCPIQRWKVVDINEARFDIITLTEELIKERDPVKKEGLQAKLNDAERLYEGAQFTIYAVPGQEGEEVGNVIRQMEDALRTAGIRTTERPESDEPLPNTEYSSFRIGSKTVDSQGVPVLKRIDPFDADYPEFKATFKDHPFFQAL